MKFEGIYYKDGKQLEGKTNTVEIDHRVGWSRKIDNRLVANRVTVDEKISSFEETFNKLRTFSSLDIMSQFSATAQGEVLGIGGSVTQYQQHPRSHRKSRQRNSTGPSARRLSKILWFSIIRARCCTKKMYSRR